MTRISANKIHPTGGEIEPSGKPTVTVEYVNRKDERYTLYEGRTKTGKPKYYCSRKPSSSGIPAEAMPTGYEWRENPADGIVSVRKRPSTRIAAGEREVLVEAIGTQAGLKTFIADIDGDSLVAYIPDRNPEAVGELFEGMFALGSAGAASMMDWTIKHVHYSPMMRFVLHDDRERLFVVERWCYLGSIDRWIFLDGPAPLSVLVKEYARHLGHESFFDLF